MNDSKINPKIMTIGVLALGAFLLFGGQIAESVRWAVSGEPSGRPRRGRRLRARTA
ncbi:MAG: hypothetical protein IT371_30595 [Deltaproteobacteria bacterium]|nr:hypothetical protein [Deltaproteobacteria bacterium]